LNEHYTGTKRRHSNSGDTTVKIKQAGMPGQAAMNIAEIRQRIPEIKDKIRKT
jgi:hypothetical protein